MVYEVSSGRIFNVVPQWVAILGADERSVHIIQDSFCRLLK